MTENTHAKMKLGSDKRRFLLLLTLLPGVLCAQESRLALVIGNSAYIDSPLENPINDATDMAAVLEDLGFAVILSTDADRREMGRAIRQFGRELKEKRGVGLFYYAGHGMQIDNRNYLIPVGTPLEEEDEIPYEAIDVGSVLAKMESAGNALNLIILDACRNNPFPSRFRSTNRGLARVEAPIGSLVVYATAPGAVAADGDGRNGVFTGALLDQLRTDGLSLTQTIRRTRAAVVEATNGQQVPWESSSLLKDYYFSAQPDATLAKRSTIAADQTVASSLPAAPTSPGSSSQGALPDEPKAPQAPRSESNALPSVRPEPEWQTLALVDTAPSNLSEPPTSDASAEDAAGIIETAPAQSELQDVSAGGFSTLTVNVEPDDARVRIMNIVPKYTPGIKLDKSRPYDIYVTRSGYESYRQSISLAEAATTLNITLDRKTVTEPEMVAIAGGAYTMGCTKGDQQCESYEKPAKSVRVGPFFIAATEVTVAQFDEFIAETRYVTDAEKNTGGNSGCFIWSDNGGISRSEAKWAWVKGTNWRNPGYRQSSAHPVTCISWNDANRYARWLAERTGKAYALPSESEWELAARASSQGRFGRASNARELCAVANIADNSQSPSGSRWAKRVDCSDNYWFSAPVASYQANGFGLYDMQGNVWEWVADTWTNSLSATPVSGRAHVGSSGDNTRVLRGGGWDSDAQRSRLSGRSKANASGRASMTGFRLVIRGNSR